MNKIMALDLTSKIENIECFHEEQQKSMNERFLTFNDNKINNENIEKYVDNQCQIISKQISTIKDLFLQ